jgi:hypothetical protein
MIRSSRDVIHGCIAEIDKLCNAVYEEKPKHFFDTIIKTAKNKAFKDWPDDGYRLLKSALCSRPKAGTEDIRCVSNSRHNV